ncbi:hypothetical protein GGS23DRAFT_563194 [Durotheca rogersii]|uniref:uncharacterized protein n=1 Tax=Durotheca rogersii TaxID=419775 RepID=UPI0022209509|nr:uncharacterized protein GGS23DRAFT_563194 [Durotheca rogersii]KAI5864163.1 hypothetical protein GGS23DRAFT_563194 [Durotheca rogersii]
MADKERVETIYGFWRGSFFFYCDLFSSFSSLRFIRFPDSSTYFPSSPISLLLLLCLYTYSPRFLGTVFSTWKKNSIEIGFPSPPFFSNPLFFFQSDRIYDFCLGFASSFFCFSFLRG